MKLLYLLIPLLLTSVSHAQSDNTESDLLKSIVASAKVVKQPWPEYPVSLARKGIEGWVELSYVIDKQGNVIDPIVENSSGYKEFERSAIKALKRWQFEPAKENGEPVEQCDTKVRLSFALHKSGSSVTKSFLAVYDQVLAAINNQKYDDAKALLTELKEKKMSTLGEDAYYWSLEGYLAQSTGDKDAALEYYLNVDPTRIQPSHNQYVQQQTLMLAVEQGHWATALATFDRLRAGLGEQPLPNNLIELEGKIQTLIANSEPLFYTGKINDRGFWRIKLVRHQFEIGAVTGQLQELEVRCNHQRHVYQPEPNKSWHLPQQWQGCSVYVTGTPGSQFQLAETQSL